MTPRLYAVALVLAGLNLSHAAAEDTITVCSSGCDFTSINDAIQSANEGDTITIAAGNYYEGVPVDPNGKAVHLLGAINECGGPAVYIDGTGTHQSVTCTSGETTETLFENLVILNGSGFGSNGGGLMIDDSSPRFLNCMFINNAPQSGYAGGAASIRNSASPVFELCTFSGNQAASGAAVSVNHSSSPTFDTCTFVNNVATSGPSCGLSILNGGSTLISGCTLSGNSGAPGWANRAISSGGSVPTITNTIVCDNDVYGDYTDGGGNCFDACSTCIPTYGDMDCDGVTDDLDTCAYADAVDSDVDGTPDCEDLCPGDPDKTEYGVCGCGIPDIDTDLDGVLDCNDFCPDDPSCFEYQITVCSDGCDFTSINAAIDFAKDGDVIALSVEHYFEGETINFDRKGVTLRGTAGANGNPATILDGLNQHAVLHVSGDLLDGHSIRLENLIIQNGYSEGWAGGLTANQADVSAITNCIFRNNNGTAAGAAFFENNSPEITDCIFRLNTMIDFYGGSGGGAITFRAAQSSLNRCVFTLNNSSAGYGGGGAIYATTYGSVNPELDIVDCTFADNEATQGGAIWVSKVGVVLNRCSITKHRARGNLTPQFGDQVPAYGAAIYVDDYYPTFAQLTSCNVWCNYVGISVIGPGTFVNDESCIVLTNHCADTCGQDSDLDGVTDDLDLCPDENDRLDTDQDGTPDCLDGCPYNQDKTDPGVCGCGPQPYVEGDLDCDGDYDAEDARLSMAEFGIIEAGACPADTNGDGAVDGQDLAAVLSNWGLPCDG